MSNIRPLTFLKIGMSGTHLCLLGPRARDAILGEGKDGLHLLLITQSSCVRATHL